MYDANFQAANRLGQHGTVARGVTGPSIGPIAYVYRWYCKRASQFVGNCTHADVPDAPAVPDPSDTSTTGRSTSAATTTGRILNRSLDPVMSAAELLDMLEELEVVPQLVSRADVTAAFRAAYASGVALGTAAIASLAKPVGHSSSGVEAVFAPLLPPGSSTSTPGKRVGYGCGPAVPRASAQPHPEELRYPDFLDCLARLAVAAAVREQHQQQPLKGAVAVEMAAFGRAMPVGEAQEAVGRLLSHMGLERSNMLGLKQKLAALARVSSEKGARAKVSTVVRYATDIKCT